MEVSHTARLVKSQQRKSHLDVHLQFLLVWGTQSHVLKPQKWFDEVGNSGKDTHLTSKAWSEEERSEV